MQPTLRDVAKAAGVSVSTASRALSGRPGVEQAKCARIHAVARLLGWRPDPLLSALSKYRQRTHTQVVCIGHLCAATGGPHHAAIVQAVAHRAQALGYLTQIFAADDPALPAKLAARRIRGVILQVEEHEVPITLDWEHLTCVQVLGQASRRPWPVVAPNHFQDVGVVMSRVKELGFQRPALMVPAWFAEGPGRDTLAIWRAWAAPGLEEPFHWHHGDDAALARWWRRLRPDCLIHQGGAWPITTLSAQGIGWSTMLGFVSLDLDAQDSQVSGIWSDRPRLATVAVDLLHARLIARISGQHAQEPFLAIGGLWCEGTTLSRR